MPIFDYRCFLHANDDLLSYFFVFLAWKSPDSLQMSLVAHFFKLSMVLRQDTYIISSSHLKGKISKRSGFAKLGNIKLHQSQNAVLPGKLRRLTLNSWIRVRLDGWGVHPTFKTESGIREPGSGLLTFGYGRHKMQMG
jgi:hypothetical protein